jgi:hypothetical protein
MLDTDPWLEEEKEKEKSGRRGIYWKEKFLELVCFGYSVLKGPKSHDDISGGVIKS